MEPFSSLIELIGDKKLPELKKIYAKQDSLHAKIITELIESPGITSQKIIQKFKVTEGTFVKTLTIVKDHLWDFHAKYIRTSYDDIFVLREMMMSGKIDHALKYYTSLRKEFEYKQQWDKLDCLYIEGLRYAQITGNDSLAGTVSKEKINNSKRLQSYTELFSELVPEMIRLEGLKIKVENLSIYQNKIEQLYNRAVELNHHLLIHNALHIKYLYYVRYTDDVESAFETVKKIKDNAERNKKLMAKITYAISLNNFLNFQCIYRHFGSPEEMMKVVEKNIHHGGQIARVNFYYSVLEYFLFEKKLSEVSIWMSKLRNTEDHTKFSQYWYIVSAILSFIKMDHQEFQKNMHLFYGHPSHRFFSDIEINLRLI